MLLHPLLLTASAILSKGGRCVSLTRVRPAALRGSRAALLQDPSQGGFGGAVLGHIGGRVGPPLGETELAGFQVDGRVLLSVSQLRGQTEGGELHGAPLELHG